LNARRLILWLWLAAALAVPALASSAGAAIEPPWCGTPMPDAAENLPSTGPGNFAHIPYYAIGCTLDSIAAQSNGRMTVRRFGHSALGRDKFEVVINELSTKEQRKAFDNWEQIRRYALDNPEKAQKFLNHAGDEIKVPLFIQGGIHGNEYEGVDASMQVIERLATTPYGTDPEVDRILDRAILIFNPVQNPDGRIAGIRQNGNGFDLNRDFLTQSQPEVQSTVELIQKWLSPELLDLHGYVTPTLIEATTKPHNPGIEYDMWLKWNQSRIDANEAAMNAQGFQVTRPINDWCSDGEFYDPATGLCPDGTDHWGPRWAESWDDWGPFYTPMYSQLVGLNGSTVEMCNSTSTVTGSSPPRTPCGPLLSENEKIGRRGSRTAQYITVWSTLIFDTANRVDLMQDQLEIYRRGVTDAARPPLSSFPPDFQQPENYWMTEYPKAYVIPKGEGQRSDPEASRLVRWLVSNGIRVEELHKGYQYGSTRLEAGSWVVFMDQALRGLADTALGPGQDVTPRISILYAPPGAWSHGFLWGADVISIPDSATFAPKTKEVKSVGTGPGGVMSASGATAFALELDSATAVRTLNQLLADGVGAELATAPFTNALGEQMPAGTIIFPASAQSMLAAAGGQSGVWFIGISGALPASEPIDRSPQIAVLLPANANPLTAAENQDVWVLRSLGFTANLIATSGTSALNDPAAANPLQGYDVVFNRTTWPTGPTAQARLTAFFAAGGGYLGTMTNGASFLTAAGQVTGLTAANRGGAGRSGIVYWNNSASGTGLITGAYRSQDTAIMDPPTWFTGVPASWTVDGSLPLTGFFLSGLWPIAGDLQSATAPGAPVIAHGMNIGGTARMAAFAMNPLYRADPEREWPMISSAALWADQ
jgi:Zinc carboxypeptidase